MTLRAKINEARQASVRMIDHARAAGQSALVPTSMAYGMPGLPGGTNLGEAAEQYRHFRGWAYVAVSAIARRIAGQPFYVARQTTQPRRRAKSIGDELTPLASHPLLDALDDPNELQVRWSLLFSTVASLELTGRAYWWFAESQRPGMRFDIWPIPASWIEPLDPLRGSWRIKLFGGLDTIDVPGQSIAYFSLPDPGNPFGAVSPLSTQAAAIDADEAIQTAQAAAFRNGLFPGVILKAGRLPGMMPGQPGELPILEPAQRKQLIDAIRSMYRGAAKYGEPFIVDGMLEGVEPFTHAPDEMAFLDSGRMTKSRILQAYGVNPLLVGEIDGANRAQATVAEESFCSNCVNPLLELMGQVVTGWMGGAFGEKLTAWFEPCRANDPEQTLREWELALRMGAATRNEYRSRILGLDAMPNGDTALVPGNMLPDDSQPSDDKALAIVPTNRLGSPLNGHAYSAS